MKTRNIVSIVIALGSLVFILLQTGPAFSFVPRPIEEENLIVAEGEIYPFPWTERDQCESLVPGCFRIEIINEQMVVIYYERFSITNEQVNPSGLFFGQEILKTGSRETIFDIGQDPPRQIWVHAVYSPKNKEIRFLQFPADVTRKAKIYRFMVLDFAKRSLREKTRVEAQEPVTLIESGAVEKAIPGTFLLSPEVNDKTIAFPFSAITNLNFPEGINFIETEINWKDDKKTVCPWSPYEGRKMSLPVETELTIKNNDPTPFSVSLSSFGLPEEIWQNYQVILETEPVSERLIEKPLQKVIRFSPTEKARIKIKPVILYQNATFPVIICVTTHSSS